MLFESIYNQCREQWLYRIPEISTERDKLRLICQRALAFENYFLRVNKQFLLSELHSAAPPAKRHALWVQAKIPYIDHEIIETVRGIVDSGDEELIEVATDALQALEKHASP